MINDKITRKFLKFCRQKGGQGDKGNGAILMKRPLNIGHIPPETGNIYQVLKRSQLEITQILSDENGNLAGGVEEQMWRNQYLLQCA